MTPVSVHDSIGNLVDVGSNSLPSSRSDRHQYPPIVSRSPHVFLAGPTRNYLLLAAIPQPGEAFQGLTVRV